MKDNRREFVDNLIADDLRRKIFNVVEDLLLWARTERMDEELNTDPGRRFFNRVLREFLGKNTNEIESEVGLYSSILPRGIEDEIIRGKPSRVLELINIIISHGEYDSKNSVKNEVEKFTRHICTLFEKHDTSYHLDESQNPFQFILYYDNKKQKESTRKTIKVARGNTVVEGKVFIGHGRSPVWRELKDFITDSLGLPVDEFNRSSAAGKTIVERLNEMLDTASAALLVMTGEDEQQDGKLRARENVVHEAGLFQGRLGFEKAVIVLEEGCEKFSNVDGLVCIEFPRGKIRVAFADIQEFFKREGLL